MSRFHEYGTNPENQERVSITYGWDVVPGYKAGWFFQVWSENEDEIADSCDGEGLLVNEGFLEGISKDRLQALGREWSCDVSKV